MGHVSLCGLILLLGAASLWAQSADDKVPALRGKGRPQITNLYAGNTSDRLPQLIDRVSMAQSNVREKQANLALYAKRTGGSIRTELFVKERLHDLDTARNENSVVYSEFSKTVDDAGTAGSPPELNARIKSVAMAQKALQNEYNELLATYQKLWPKAPPVIPAMAAGTMAAAPVEGKASMTAPVVDRPASGAGETANPGGRPVASGEGDGAALPAGEASYRAELGVIQALLSSGTADPQQKADAYRRFLKLKSEHERHPAEPMSERR